MNLSERGIYQPDKRMTRRYFLGGAAATALALAGCTGIDLPSGAQSGGRPQAASEPQIDEEAARGVSAVSVVAILTMLFFLRGIK